MKLKWVLSIAIFTLGFAGAFLTQSEKPLNAAWDDHCFNTVEGYGHWCDSGLYLNETFCSGSYSCFGSWQWGATSCMEVNDYCWNYQNQWCAEQNRHLLFAQHGSTCSPPW